MSSMQRSIRRSIEKKRGTFQAQKPLRSRRQPSFKEFITSMIHKRKIDKLTTKEDN